jgi:hypothetical protein
MTLPLGDSFAGWFSCGDAVTADIARSLGLGTCNTSKTCILIVKNGS